MLLGEAEKISQYLDQLVTYNYHHNLDDTIYLVYDLQNPGQKINSDRIINPESLLEYTQEYRINQLIGFSDLEQILEKLAEELDERFKQVNAESGYFWKKRFTPITLIIKNIQSLERSQISQNLVFLLKKIRGRAEYQKIRFNYFIGSEYGYDLNPSLGGITHLSVPIFKNGILNHFSIFTPPSMLFNHGARSGYEYSTLANEILKLGPDQFYSFLDGEKIINCLPQKQVMSNVKFKGSIKFALKSSTFINNLILKIEQANES